MNPICKYLAALVIALGMSTDWLDGPTDMQALQDVSAEANAVYTAVNEVHP